MAELQTQTLYNIKLLPRSLKVPDDHSLQSEKFYVSIIVNHEVHIYFSPDDDFPELHHSIAINKFELDPNTVLSESMISQILSSMGISIDHQPQIVHNVISFAHSMITNVNYLRPLLTVLITKGTVVEYAEIDMFRPVPATSSSIEALKKVRFEGLNSTELCMICLERLNSAIEVTQMPCSHLYHGDCIVRWLETSHFCPVCRFKMPT